MWAGGTSDLYSESRLKERVKFLTILFSVAFLIILLRLFYMQVIRGDEFAQVSESNRTQTIFLGAPRGNFYDTKGRKIVTNRPSWSLLYSVSGEEETPRNQIEKRLMSLQLPHPKRWKRRLREAYKTKRLVRLVDDVPSQTAFGIREMGDLMPGFQMEMEFRRDYPNGVLAPQIVGYLSEISKKELKEDFWFARKLGDLIGKMGLEKVLDSLIRGKDGGMLIEVDSFGRLKRVIRELAYQRGSSVQLTLDIDLQRLAQDELENTKTQRGAVVVLDAQTGAIRAWASAPTFDPSGSLAEDVMDENFPFFDRVYKGAYPPGSIYKIMTAIAGFESGVLKPGRKINCVGFVTLKDRRLKERKYRCWRKHGEVNYWKAMRMSCDSYFYLLGKAVGSQAIYETSIQFGLGKTVQTFLPGENEGTIPNPAWKRKRGLGGWSTGDTFNMSIGQGYVTVTPLQMAVMMGAVLTRGKIFQPFLIERIFDSEEPDFIQTEPLIVKEVELKDSTWESILYSTQLVVEKGTGKASRVPYLTLHGKTGTAQNPHGKDHAWFIAGGGYPDEEPKYIVCVFVENGGHGGSAAAPIARRIFKAALPPRPKGGSV